MGILCSYPEADLGDLITEAQTFGQADERAITKIVWRFEGLTRKIGRQVANGRPYRADVENAARFGLTRAVYRHRGNTRTFAAYARLYMTGAARQEVGRWLEPDDCSPVELDDAKPKDLMSIVPVDELADHGGWGSGDTADAITMLDEGRQRLLVRRYIDDADLTTIATEAGTSVSAISQRLSTIHRHLRPVLAA
jgi:DNA-directed RNA polymerase specialized sigma subunit